MRIIHTGDIHLGAVPDAVYNWSDQRAREIRQSFQRLIGMVEKEKPELLIIAGDLFHRQPQMSQLKEVNYLFSKIPQTKVVLIVGNHDYIDRNSFWQDISWSDNVIPLFADHCQSKPIPELDLRVYGCSYHSREVTENLYETVKAEGREKYHILVMHGGDAKHSPFDIHRRNLQTFDYLAAGHIHKPDILQPGKMAFCGALEPLDRNDTGPHGYMDVTLEEEGTNVRFVPFAVRSYLDLPVEVAEDMVWGEIRDLVRGKIRAMGRDNIYRIILQGIRQPDLTLQTEELCALGNVTEVQDQTRMAWDYEEICRRYRGSMPEMFIHSLLQSGENETIRELALEYGMEALLSSRGESRLI